MAKLYFRYGAMGSSKTANAIMVQYNYRERGQRAMIFKPCLDNRDGDKFVGSRSGLRAPCEFIEALPGMDLSELDCIIVDEAQFLTREQVEMLVSIVDDHSIPVICYGLRADFRGELFEGSRYLLAWADTIEEIKTVCWCGKKAIYNARIEDGHVVKSGEQIKLGGNESYVALCRKHWKSGELSPMEIRKIEHGKKHYMPLLLLADPEEPALDKYLEDGDMYVLFINGKPVSEAVVSVREDGQCELKNLATAEDEQNKGYAGRIVRYLFGLYRTMYREMYVGTAFLQRAFYEHLGFEYTYTVENFFVDNYAEPVIDQGYLLKDMIYLKKTL